MNLADRQRGVVSSIRKPLLTTLTNDILFQVKALIDAHALWPYLMPGVCVGPDETRWSWSLAAMKEVLYL